MTPPDRRERVLQVLLILALIAISAYALLTGAGAPSCSPGTGQWVNGELRCRL